MDPVYTDEKLGVFFEKCCPKSDIFIFSEFSKILFFFRILEINFQYFGNFRKKTPKTSRFKWIFENISTCQGRQGAHWAHVPPRALY